MNRKYLLIAVLAAAPAFANDVDPFGFEKEHFMSSRSRAQVAAELTEAQAAGELPVIGEIGVQRVAPPSGLTRAQVVAETLAAGRFGLLLNRGERGPLLATPEQTHQIEIDGLRARDGAAES